MDKIGICGPFNSCQRKSPYQTAFDAAVAAESAAFLPQAAFADIAAPSLADPTMARELSGLTPQQRAASVQAVLKSDAPAEQKVGLIGLLYDTYKTSGERMGRLMESARSFAASLPDELSRLGNRIGQSLDVNTRLSSLSWESLVAVLRTSFNNAVQSLGVTAPTLAVTWLPESRGERAYFDPRRQMLVINLNRTNTVKDLGVAMMHEMTHDEQGERVAEGDHEAAMLAVNQKVYFPGSVDYDLYRANPIEKEAFAVGKVVEAGLSAQA